MNLTTSSSKGILWIRIPSATKRSGIFVGSGLSDMIKYSHMYHNR